MYAFTHIVSLESFSRNPTAAVNLGEGNWGASVEDLYLTAFSLHT